MEARREILLNAMVHKNYIGAMTPIRVYDDKLTAWNAGGLPSEISVEQLKKAHPSIPRNPLIADVCYRAGYIDTWGRGIQKIVSACRESGLNDPQFEDVFGGLRVTLTGHRLKEPPEAVTAWSAEKSAEKTPGKTPGKTPVKILQLLLDNPEMTIPEIAGAIDKSTSAVERALRKLRTDGYVKRIDPAKGGYWQVIVNEED